MFDLIWLNPLAWFALAAAAAPVLIHLLAHRRAKRVPFPTLRFIQPTRLASIRRRTLEDLPLLGVRVAIVAAAVAAFAGPLVVTPARRASWNARLVRAVVVSGPSEVDFGPALLSQRFESAALPDGIHRAVTWLESAPPARRELVVAGPLTIGSLNDADLAAIPPDVGIRFSRTRTPPSDRIVEVSPLLTRTGAVRQTVTLAGPATHVREEPLAARANWPVDVVAQRSLQPTVDAALTAVSAMRVRVPPSDRRARLVFLDSADAVVADAAPIRTPWMADAVARIARDPDLLEQSARAAAGIGDTYVTKAPWQVLASAADGRPIAAAAASSGRLVVAAVASPGDLVVPVLLRAIANSLTPVADMRASEVLPIADAQLRAWTREPGLPPRPRPGTFERDDRRWLWVAILGLLALEMFLRRSRRADQSAIEMETARVA